MNSISDHARTCSLSSSAELLSAACPGHRRDDQRSGFIHCWGVPNRDHPKILENGKITTSMNTLEQHRNLRVFCQFRWLLRRFRTQQSEGTIPSPLRGVFSPRLVWCGSPFLALAEPGRKHFSGKQTPPHCWPIFSRMHSIYP